ncbi:MAG: hypothetical protein HY287_05825 [Planctomycetes bacterium]|nr:hypothetical protein [Planctomycetota bacterium]
MESISRRHNECMSGIVILGGIFAAGASVQAGARVAIVDTNSPHLAQSWCDYFVQLGNQCTVFPVTGPTSSLDPFTVLIDLSEVWSDPNGEIAAFLHAGKGVIF